MKFKNWVDANGGAGRVALLLNIDRQRIYRWLDRKCTPQSRMVLQLVELGGGAFTAEDVLRETLPLTDGGSVNGGAQ